MKTQKELAEIALKIFKNEIWCSWFIRKGEEHMLPNIFMPLIFLSNEDKLSLVEKKVSCFYADMSNAGPRTVNGYPIFSTVGYLTDEENKKVFEIYSDLQKKSAEIVNTNE